MNDTAALDYALQLIQDGILSIDAEGCIWRHAVLSHGIWRSVTTRRAESIGGKGYLRLMLSINGRLRGVGAHRVVWTVLHGPIPDGMQINHIDLNKQHNHPDNLEPVTGMQNLQHSLANGHRPAWAIATEWRPGRPRLNQAQIAEARQLRSDGVLLRVIAAKLGIAVSHAHRITS